LTSSLFLDVTQRRLVGPVYTA